MKDKSLSRITAAAVLAGVLTLGGLGQALAQSADPADAAIQADVA